MPLHATKSMPGRNSQRQLAMKQLYAGCWVVSRYIGVIHQLAAFPWFWVLSIAELNAKPGKKCPQKPTLAICQVAEMVDPWHGIYHWWWGNAIHSKKQRFGPVRSKSAGALVSRQGNMMVEEGPWWCHPLIEFKEYKLLSMELWAFMFEFFLWVSGFSAFPFTRSYSE